MSETCLMVLLWIEEHAEGPSQPFCLFLRQITASDHIFDDLNLLWLNCEEEESKWDVVCHYVFEEHSLTWLEFLDKFGNLLNEL